MKKLVPILLVAVLTVAVSAATSQPFSAAEREALKKFFDPKFVVSSVPKEKEDDLFRMTKLFAVGREEDEFVRRLEFRSEKEVLLYFSNRGIHGGGVVISKKQNGGWVIDRKVYAT